MKANNIHKLQHNAIWLHCSVHYGFPANGSFRYYTDPQLEPCTKYNDMTKHYYIGKNKYGIYMYYCCNCERIWLDDEYYEGFTNK